MPGRVSWPCGLGGFRKKPVTASSEWVVMRGMRCRAAGTRWMPGGAWRAARSRAWRARGVAALGT